jgi:hypothetical protein
MQLRRDLLIVLLALGIAAPLYLASFRDLLAVSLPF